MVFYKFFVHLNEVKLTLLKLLITLLHEIVTFLIWNEAEVSVCKLLGQIILHLNHLFEFSIQLLVAAQLHLLIKFLNLSFLLVN